MNRCQDNKDGNSGNSNCAFTSELERQSPEPKKRKSTIEARTAAIGIHVAGGQASIAYSNSQTYVNAASTNKDQCTSSAPHSHQSAQQQEASFAAGILMAGGTGIIHNPIANNILPPRQDSNHCSQIPQFPPHSMNNESTRNMNYHKQPVCTKGYTASQSSIPVETASILQAINKAMWGQLDSIKRSFITQTNLDFCVYPQISESPDFYRGKHRVDTTDGRSGMRPTQYKPTHFPSVYYSVPSNYHDSDDDNNDTEHRKHPFHSFKSVMEEFSMYSKEIGKLQLFGLFAQAGSGKTTCMRDWATQTMNDNNIKPENNFDLTLSESSRFSLVLYYDLKNIAEKQETTLKDILFEGIVKDEEKNTAYEWILEFDSKVIIFLDGLDQTTWTIDEKHERDIGPHKTANTPTIMYNLFARISLPRSRIIMSSREFKAATLPCDARPQKIFTLAGFSKSDAKLLFNSLVCPKFPENPWDEISKFSPSVRHFLTTPMYLTFAALVYVKFEGYIPNSVTSLLVKVLEALENSTNIRERENIWTIISKLKGLAHEGMQKSLVVFTHEDLQNHGLTLEVVNDLLLMVPSSNTGNQRLLAGDLSLYFCHQTIQELLSACAIIELPFPQFTEFTQKYLFKDNMWEAVRLFVCELLFMKSPSKILLQISDAPQKQVALREIFISQVNDIERDWNLELCDLALRINDDEVSTQLVCQSLMRL